MITIKLIIFCSASGAYTSYGRSTTSTALFLSTLHCSGIEGDIGMCSGNFDIQNCSTEAVAVDCTGWYIFTINICYYVRHPFSFCPSVHLSQ